jgi:hypothetical protein
MEQKAEELKQRGLKILNAEGLLLPKRVRDLLADLLALVAELSKVRQ